MRLKVKRMFSLLLFFFLVLFLIYLHKEVDEEPIRNISNQFSRLNRNTVLLRNTAGKLVSTEQDFARRKRGKNCPDLTKPVNVIDSQKFQKVTNGSELYVFSALYDEVNKPLVQVIGLSQHRINHNVVCQLWFEGEGEDLIVVASAIKGLPESHSLLYTAMQIKCMLPDNRKPYAMSVVTESCQVPNNLLKIIYFSKIESNFTVCLTPFNFHYSRAYELVEWIEMNRLMGADSFTFYNYSTGVNVDQVLQLYTSMGLVNVIQWKLPVKVDHWPPVGRPEVHYFAQMAALNDCLYRNRYRSKYLVYEDVDEIIIPRTAKNWPELLSKKSKAAFIFRCNFFRKDWPSFDQDFEGKEKALKYKSIFLFTTLKEQKVYSYNMRSKYIIDPRIVGIVGIHNIWEFSIHGLTDQIPPSDALLHHYRNWEKPDEKIPRVTDTLMHNFKKPLLSRLEYIWSQLKNVRMDIPISEYPSPL